jgi:predicted RNase H-like HicB family nuclease
VGDGWRHKIAGQLLVQVTPDLPNSAEHEVDRHHDSDFESHQQNQSHWRAATLKKSGSRGVPSGTNLQAARGNCYSINNIATKPQRTVPKSAFWQHSAKVARLRKFEDDIHTARMSIVAEFRRYPLRVEQSKLDGWWFVFVDALPELVVFGPNYEDLLGRLKRVARNVLRARGETVTDIEITTFESGKAAMALWVIPGGKTGVMGAPLKGAL